MLRPYGVIYELSICICLKRFLPGFSRYVQPLHLSPPLALLKLSTIPILYSLMRQTTGPAPVLRE